MKRLVNQHLAAPSRSPVELVAAFGAIQAQEYEHAKWAIGVRAPGTTEPDIERLLARGEILRTHPMRGTHHFVAAADMRWLMALMGPLMIKRNERRNRELDLDEKTLTKALTAIERSLAGGRHMTRAEVAAVLRRVARIAPDGQRLSHIIYRAELEALVCSGARNGKQITIALFDERVPRTKPLSREDSLRQLALRYFTTRAPASLRDFIWWCQLPAADARAAIALANIEHIDGTYYAIGTPRVATPPRAFLLPPYDEYTVAYADRSAAGTPPPKTRTFAEATLLAPNLVVDGKVVGTWRRTLNKGRPVIELAPWTKLTAPQRAALRTAEQRYLAFYSPRN